MTFVPEIFTIFDHQNLKMIYYEREICTGIECYTNISPYSDPDSLVYRQYH